MSDEKRSYYLFNLDRHTEKVKTAFASLVFDLQKSLEQERSVVDIICYLKLIIEDINCKKLLNDCSTVAEIFDIINLYSSFFDFEYIKILTRKFGSIKVKKTMKKYTNMFQEYLKRRIVEIPDDAFDNENEFEKLYKVKTDHVLNNLSGEDLKKLQYEMNKILGHKLVRLLRVEEGCTQLTFRGFEINFDNLSKQELQALRNVGVQNITHGEYSMAIKKEFDKENTW